jgi:hypothetical protein
LPSAGVYQLRQSFPLSIKLLSQDTHTHRKDDLLFLLILPVVAWNSLFSSSSLFPPPSRTRRTPKSLRCEIFLSFNRHLPFTNSDTSATMMKTFFVAMALVALAIATGWEIIPLSHDAEVAFDPATWNISNYDPTLYNVTRLPDNPNEANMFLVDPPDEPNRPAPGDNLSTNQTNVDSVLETFEQCNSTGSPLLRPEWCVPSWEHDQTQCNVAYLVPHTPVSLS